MQKLTSSGRGTGGRRTTPVWLWALIPMLLAAAMVAPFLGRDIFDVDEAATMIGACAGHLGPCSPAEAVRASARWPGQSQGHVIVFSQWGQLVGWSEFAIRSLSWLVGPLTLAWVFRLGRDLFTPVIALAAALLLATSVIFLTYMHVARFYGPAMLFPAIALWGYWRVALAERPPYRLAQAALVLGAAGLLYSNYFGALLVPALGIYHLFLAPRGRRWRRAPVLLVLAVLLALPQAPDLINGIAFNQGKEGLHERAVHAPEVLSLFLRYLSGDLLNVPPPLASLLILALPPCLLAFCWARSRRRRPPDAVLWLLVTSVLSLLFIAAVNEWARVFAPHRVRYLAALWPPSALLLGLALLHPTRTPLLPRPGVVLFLAIALSGASDFLQDGPLVRTAWAWRDNDVTMATMQEVVRELAEGEPESLLVVDKWFLGSSRLSEAYYSAHARNRVLPNDQSTAAELLRRAPGYHDILFLLDSSRWDDLNFQDHLDFFLQRLWVQQFSWSRDGITLLRLASPFLNPLPDQSLLEFDRSIDFLGAGKLQANGTLHFVAHMRSADHNLLSHYSLALHVIDPRTGKRVAQGDVGVGPGFYVMAESEIDAGALPPGDYEVHVALYDWQTGERLIARDPQTGTVSDMQVLQRFRIG